MSSQCTAAGRSKTVRLEEFISRLCNSFYHLLISSVFFQEVASFTCVLTRISYFSISTTIEFSDTCLSQLLQQRYIQCKFLK